VKHGYAFPGESFVDFETDSVLVTPGNFCIGGGFRLDKPKFHKGEIPDGYILSAGDLVVTMTDLSKASDTLGYGAIIPDLGGKRFLHNQRVGKIVLKSGADSCLEYLHWVLRTQSYRNEVIASASGSTVKHTAPSRIEAYRFQLPPISVQKSIAHILGTLDDKIELNRRINQTLEEMAQALFKSWFVDFDPVKAKASVLEEGGAPQQAEQAAMQTISGKTSDELESFKTAQPDAYAELARTASLFPSRLIESELGQIPEGWEIAKLNQVCSYLARGIGPSYCEPGVGAVRVLNQKCIREGKVDLTPSRLHDSTKRSIQGRELQDLDILVNSTGQGTLGRTAQIGEPESVTVVDSHVTVLRADASKISKLYLGINIRLREQEIESLAEGSTGQTELSRIRLGELSVLVPGFDLFQSFDACIESVFHQKMQLTKECSRLAECRDSLLPKLLSGELEIPDELLSEAVA